MKLYKKIRNCTLIIMLTTMSFYCINQLVFYLSTIKEMLHSRYGNTYSWRFGKIFYTKQGEGSPVLCIHNVDTSSSSMEFQNIIQKLAEKHTVYAIDLLGCGRSSKPKITYTTYMYVQLINDFIQNVIGTKTNVIASGKSASFTCLSCTMEPDNFNKILCINPEDIKDMNKYPTKRKKMRKYMIEIPFIGTMIYNLFHRKIKIKNLFAKKHFYDSSKIKPKYILEYHESCHLGWSSSKYLYSSLVSDYLSCNIFNCIKNLNHSLYFVLGEYEYNSEDILTQYQSLNPSIEGNIIKNTKHLPQLEDASAILHICDIFF
ncbi:MAG: hypothetical protein PHD70_08580 [Anaerostipes sp.]|jgi:pimeloyl-ACP methyl ester carboxylesterase|nr:hypothetical protein [Anaerostipes sp.]MDD3746510.1 hypothetical protein [Anaerostipes sp.]